MEYSIESKVYGKRITFSRPGSRYVFIDTTGGKRPGTLGEQICSGGYISSGSTIEYIGDQAGFEQLCKSWWKKHLENLRS